MTCFTRCHCASLKFNMYITGTSVKLEHPNCFISEPCRNSVSHIMPKGVTETKICSFVLATILSWFVWSNNVLCRQTVKGIFFFGLLRSIIYNYAEPAEKSSLWIWVGNFHTTSKTWLIAFIFTKLIPLWWVLQAYLLTIGIYHIFDVGGAWFNWQRRSSTVDVSPAKLLPFFTILIRCLAQIIIIVTLSSLLRSLCFDLPLVKTALAQSDKWQ